jgi:hypothetical protein
LWGNGAKNSEEWQKTRFELETLILTFIIRLVSLVSSLYIFFVFIFFEFCKLDMVHHFIMHQCLKIWGQSNKMTKSYEVVCKKAKDGLTSFVQFESLSLE